MEWGGLAPAGEGVGGSVHFLVASYKRLFATGFNPPKPGKLAIPWQAMVVVSYLISRLAVA